MHFFMENEISIVTFGTYNQKGYFSPYGMNSIFLVLSPKYLFDIHNYFWSDFYHKLTSPLYV